MSVCFNIYTLIFVDNNLIISFSASVCFMPMSKLFHLYQSINSEMVEETKYPEKTTDHQQGNWQTFWTIGFVFSVIWTYICGEGNCDLLVNTLYHLATRGLHYFWRQVLTDLLRSSTTYSEQSVTYQIYTCIKILWLNMILNKNFENRCILEKGRQLWKN